MEQIKEFVLENGRASITELGDLLKVSQATIRRDISQLVVEGVLVRLHGGAAMPETPKVEPFFQRASTYAECKQKIGKSAAELIGNGETVFLGSGTTALEVAKNLRGKQDLTIITNSLPVLNTLASLPEIKVIVIGGFLRYDELSFIGHLVEKALKDLRADKVVMGIQGIHLEQGLTNEYLPEAMSDRAIVCFSETLIIVADSTKFGRVKPSFVSDLARVSRIVTDGGAPPDMVAELVRRGIPVTVAE